MHETSLKERLQLIVDLWLKDSLSMDTNDFNSGKVTAYSNVLDLLKYYM